MSTTTTAAPTAPRDPRLEILGKLRAPFTDEQRKTITGGPSKGQRYVPWGEVVDRLDRVAIAWDWEIVDHRWDERAGKNGTPIVMYVVIGRLTIAGLGARTGMGIQDVQDGAGKDWIKGAEANALKRAAAMFGVPIGFE